MALFVCIETSTSVSSVALYNGSELIASEELFGGKYHSGALVNMVQNTLSISGYTLKNVDAVAVSKGPGSYTGLRIGVSTAKGLCFALGIPLIAVNTLEAMATGMNKYNFENMLLCPMLDARRMEVYCMLLNSNLNIISETEAKVLNDESFKAHLDDCKILFFGNGSDKAKKMIRHKNAAFISGIHPTASDIGTLVFDRYRLQKFEDLAYFEPLYLKDFVGSKPSRK